MSALLDASTSHFCAAVSRDLRLLARLQAEIPKTAQLVELSRVQFPDNLGLHLQTGEGRKACDFMRQALGMLPAPDDFNLLQSLRADFVRIYTNLGGQLPTTCLENPELSRQVAMYQVQKCYQEHGGAVEKWRLGTKNYAVVQLEFLAHLFERARHRSALREPTVFMERYLLPWFGEFLRKTENHCCTLYYSALLGLVCRYLEELREILAALSEYSSPGASPSLVCPAPPVHIGKAAGEFHGTAPSQ